MSKRRYCVNKPSAVGEKSLPNGCLIALFSQSSTSIMASAVVHPSAVQWLVRLLFGDTSSVLASLPDIQSAASELAVRIRSRVASFGPEEDACSLELESRVGSLMTVTKSPGVASREGAAAQRLQLPVLGPALLCPNVNNQCFFRHTCNPLSFAELYKILETLAKPLPAAATAARRYCASALTTKPIGCATLLSEERVAKYAHNIRAVKKLFGASSETKKVREMLQTKRGVDTWNVSLASAGLEMDLRCTLDLEKVLEETACREILGVDFKRPVSTRHKEGLAVRVGSWLLTCHRTHSQDTSAARPDEYEAREIELEFHEETSVKALKGLTPEQWRQICIEWLQLSLVLCIYMETVAGGHQLM